MKCSWIKKSDVEGQSKVELDKISYLKIDNCFSKQCFGGCNRGIHGATPSEILHSIQLGLCEYVADSLNYTFTQSALDIISNTVVGIFQDSYRQSERDLPDLGPFRNGLMSVASLKAKERFARVYCVFLALSNSFCIKELCKKRRKKRLSDGDNDPPMITLRFLRAFANVIESTILFHEWMKQDRFLKTDFKNNNLGTDCRAQKRIKEYLQSFKDHIKRGGNGLKTPKFHQMLHICDYIRRHGAPMNYDGARGENFGKTKIKDNAKLTNKQKDSLSFDIGRRVSEEDIVDQASSIYYRNVGRWPSKCCNDQDLLSYSTPTEQVQETDNQMKPRYYLRAVLTDNSDHIQAGSKDKYDIHIDWGGKSKTPMFPYSSELLTRLASRLFVGDRKIGGKIDDTCPIPGLTQTIVDGVIYRSHPSYSKKGNWFDWAYFDWAGFEKHIPARIMMIVDLSGLDIMYDNDVDENSTSDSSDDDQTILHLTRAKWAIVWAGESPKVSNADLSNDHFDSSIHHRIKLHEQKDLFLVPLSSLIGPCFVVQNKDYTSGIYLDDNETDNTCYVVQPKSSWPNAFLPSVIV